jgi:hypothetical protein
MKQRNEVFHIVRWNQLDDFLALGWMMVADLGDVHGRWSCLCEWRCACRMVTPHAA